MRRRGGRAVAVPVTVAVSRWLRSFLGRSGFRSVLFGLGRAGRGTAARGRRRGVAGAAGEAQLAGLGAAAGIGGARGARLRRARGAGLRGSWRGGTGTAGFAESSVSATRCAGAPGLAAAFGPLGRSPGLGAVVGVAGTSCAAFGIAGPVRLPSRFASRRSPGFGTARPARSVRPDGRWHSGGRRLARHSRQRAGVVGVLVGVVVRCHGGHPALPVRGSPVPGGGGSGRFVQACAERRCTRR
ncbi:predicted protein [Streptomyces sp. AA4]|nr:predicted protein [Streptomyces sp. AA4]